MKIVFMDSKREEVTIKAHESSIIFASLNREGTFIATASIRGTLIRVFDCDKGEMMQELRRGAEKAEIFYIEFDRMTNFVACSSERGTMHIFSLSFHKGEGEKSKNKKSIFLKLTKMLHIQSDYINSEWSFAKFKLGEKCIFGFGKEKENEFYVISANGKFCVASFDMEEGGDVIIKEKYVINYII